MKIVLKASANQIRMRDPGMRKSNSEIDEFIAQLKSVEDIKVALAEVMKQITALRENVTIRRK